MPGALLSRRRSPSSRQSSVHSLHAQPNDAGWDEARDDERLLMLQVGGGDGEVSELIVIQNFFSILEERPGR